MLLTRPLPQGDGAAASVDLQEVIARSGGPTSFQAHFEHEADRSHRIGESKADGALRRFKEYAVFGVSAVVVTAMVVAATAVLLLSDDADKQRWAAEVLRLILGAMLGFLAGKSVMK